MDIKADIRVKSPVEVTTPGETQVVVKRRFNAPAALVWRCYTEPDLVKRWLLGPPDWSMPVCEIDLRVGGEYTYRWRNDVDGTEFGFAGTFSRIDPERRIEHSERPVDLDDWAASDSHNVVAFVPVGDMTELVMSMTYASADVREQVLATGMTDGMGMSFDNLDEVLADTGTT